VLTEHRAPQLGELDTFAALRLWADLHIQRQAERGCQGGMLLTQTLRDTAPLRASLDAVLTYIGTFAADPGSAAKALRLPLAVPPVIRVSS
jgi:hypothetical protein